MYYYYGAHIILIALYTDSINWYSFHAHLREKESEAQRNYDLPSVTWPFRCDTWI